MTRLERLAIEANVTPDWLRAYLRAKIAEARALRKAA